jgi:uncharacterized protein
MRFVHPDKMKETRIGVISDTHYSRSKKSGSTDLLIKKITNAFKGVDLIIHAGDVVEMSLLELLGGIAPVEAVCGNMDEVDTRAALPRSKILDVSGARIGIVHGYGEYGGSPEQLLRYFGGEKLNVVVFGHTHTPFNKVSNSVLYFNPGSPVKPALPYKPSVGLLAVSAAPISITGTIIDLP